MFKSGLINREYKYKEVNLLELQTTIMKQENLTSMDILKNYHKLESFTPNYKKFEKPLFEGLKEQLEEYILTIIEESQKDYIQIISDFEDSDYMKDLYKKIKEAYQVSYKKDVPLEEILLHYNKNEVSSNVSNAIFYYRKALEDTFCSTSKKAIACKKLNEEIQFKIEKFVLEKTNNQVSINLDMFNNVGRQTLPTFISIDNIKIPDFNNIYEHLFSIRIEDKRRFSCKSKVLKNFDINWDIPYIINVNYMVPFEIAKKTFYDAIDEYANSMIEFNEISYLQEIENMPITINIDTKTNKIQLIDGYKRLLYVTSKKLLDRIVVIKEFTDLSDEEFLTLLYAANYWKASVNKGNIDFHDRGYLFALKQRFNFVLPEPFDKSFEILNIYDLTHLKNTSITRLNCDFSNWVKNKNLPESYKFQSFRIKDLKFWFNEVEEIFNKDFGYDNSYNIFLEKLLLLYLGDIRRNGGNQKEITKEIIESVLLNEVVVKTCSRKKMSSDTYIYNSFVKTRLFEHIRTILEEKLI